MTEITTTQERVTNYPGLRTIVAWAVAQIQDLWQSAKQAFVESAYNSTVAVNVTFQENVEVLAPYLKQLAEGQKPYGNDVTHDFEEGQAMVLGETLYINDLGTVITAEQRARITDPIARLAFKAYPLPSFIEDTEGVKHVVFPCREWQAASNQSEQGSQNDPTTGSWSIKPKSIVFKHNAIYLGGGLDGHAWQQVATSEGTAVIGTTLTVAVSHGAARVGQFVRMKTEWTSQAVGEAVGDYMYGFISQVTEGETQDSITIVLVGETDGSITTVEVYKE